MECLRGRLTSPRLSPSSLLQLVQQVLLVQNEAAALLQLQADLLEAEGQVLGPGHQLAPVRVRALAPGQVQDHVRPVELVHRSCQVVVVPEHEAVLAPDDRLEGEREEAVAEGGVADTPNRLLHLDDALRLGRAGHVPEFDRRVLAGGDQMVLVVAGPVDVVDAREVGVHVLDRRLAGPNVPELDFSLV